MSQHVFRIGGRDYEAEVKELTPERATVVVDGKSYEIDLVQLGRRKIAEAVRAAAPPAPAATAAVAPTRPAPPGKGEGGVVAPMPGAILALKTREGDNVVAGQTLLVMEAMKMENAITAPYAGTVTKIYVREGDATAEGDLLVDVERPRMTSL